MLLIKIAILANLLTIFVQDIRDRAVHWFLFPGLTALLMLLNLKQHDPFSETWPTVLFNFGFLALQFLCVTAYFSFKRSQWMNITESLLGWGDILFLCSIAFYLSFVNFLCFFITSLLTVLACWPVWQAFSKNKSEHIPLAGLQALLFMIFVAASWWIKPADLTKDNWWLHLVNP